MQVFADPDLKADLELTVVVVVAGLTRLLVPNYSRFWDCESERVVTWNEIMTSQVK